MSTFAYVEGIVPKTEKYDKMMSIYESCVEMKVKPPKEVLDYLKLDDNEVCDSGIVIELPEGVVEDCSDDGREIYEVDLSLLPPDVTKVRFVISY